MSCFTSESLTLTPQFNHRMTNGITLLEGRAERFKLLLKYSILRRNLEIEDIIAHSEYTITPRQENTKNDIALLKLKTPLNISKYTPACLPVSNRTFDDRIAWVYGWGLKRVTPKTRSRKLRQITARVISNQECRQPQHWPVAYLQGKLCAVGLSYDAHTCYGDSGGPLTVEEADGRNTLVGIVQGGECTGVKR